MALHLLEYRQNLRIWWDIPPVIMLSGKCEGILHMSLRNLISFVLSRINQGGPNLIRWILKNDVGLLWFRDLMVQRHFHFLLLILKKVEPYYELPLRRATFLQARPSSCQQYGCTWKRTLSYTCKCSPADTSVATMSRGSSQAISGLLTQGNCEVITMCH